MIVFDDEGESWHASSLALKRELRSSIGGQALAEYSVVNIGFVALLPERLGNLGVFRRIV